MNYIKKILIIGASGFLFLGCLASKPDSISEPKQEQSRAKKEVIKPKKELTEQEKRYEQVVNKTINDCQEHGIELNKERTEKFVGRFSPTDINKIVTIIAKIPKRNCQLFADETSLEKEQKVKVAVSKTVNECKALGVDLDKNAVEEHIMKIPLFVIKKVLEANRPSTKEDCEKMKSVL